MTGTEHGGDGNGEQIRLDRADLIDRVELVFDRATGAMQISGQAANDEVALMMLYRAVNVYEARTRAALAMAAAQAARDAQRVESILAGHRPAGRG